MRIAQWKKLVFYCAHVQLDMLVYHKRDKGEYFKMVTILSVITKTMVQLELVRYRTSSSCTIVIPFWLVDDLYDHLHFVSFSRIWKNAKKYETK